MKRDYIVVIDLEATCWKNDPPPGQQSEIIEVGVCKLDLRTLTPVDKRGLLVKPTRSNVSAFCTKLTSLTPEQVDAGMTFAAACDVLRDEYDTPEHVWLSWGDFDRRMFWAQCSGFGVDYPFRGRGRPERGHLNLKQFYADARRGGKRCGMARALKDEELPIEGRHHRGEDDAWNTARILAKLLREDSLTILDDVWEE